MGPPASAARFARHASSSTPTATHVRASRAIIDDLRDLTAPRTRRRDTLVDGTWVGGHRARHLRRRPVPRRGPDKVHLLQAGEVRFLTQRAVQSPAPAGTSWPTNSSTRRVRTSQHAHNPVEWHPWGDEALEKARDEDKPIFLSIGYSACHWCHVMERESFEDEDIAALPQRALRQHQGRPRGAARPRQPST